MTLIFYVSLFRNKVIKYSRQYLQSDDQKHDCHHVSNILLVLGFVVIDYKAILQNCCYIVGMQ